MKIIDAYWDQDITGLKTCDIIFNKTDSYKEFLKEDIDKKYNFSVVKIPAGNIELVHQLEDTGYRYLENQLFLSFNVDQLENINKKWHKLFKDFTYKEVNRHTDLDSIIEKVSDNLFVADRYSKDPLWGKNISSQRYSNWINILFEKENIMFYKMIKDQKEVGFFAIRNETDKINSCPIAGIFKEYQYSGYIFVLVWYILKISREMNAKQFITSISSNNINLLSSFSKAFHYRVNAIYVVLRKVIE